MRTAALVLVLGTTVSCADSGQPPATAPGEGSSVERAYWPTDGWRTADPAVHGFDAGELAEVERVVDESCTSVRSILVVRDGLLVHERYFDGVEADDGHDVRSVTESVVGALVGVALADGSIESLDQTVGELLSDYVPPGADPRIEDVTVRQLLSMTSGLLADDPTIAGDPCIFDEISRSPDRIRALLGLPLAARPGRQWASSNASSDLLAAILADATGRSRLDFARERLLGPLGIETDDAYEPAVTGWPPTAEHTRRYQASAVAWPTDAQGYHWGSSGLRLRARTLPRSASCTSTRGAGPGTGSFPPTTSASRPRPATCRPVAVTAAATSGGSPATAARGRTPPAATGAR